MRESIKTTYAQVDVARYCPYQFLMTQKNGQGAIKQCNARFSISVDNVDRYTEFRTGGCRGASNFPT